MGPELPGYGSIDPDRPDGQPLQWLLADELGVRGFPAMAAACPAALGIVEGLLETIPEIVARCSGPARLTHNQLHAGNLLCAPGASSPTVVGVADPGDPGGWPAESDLAHVQVAHTLGRGHDDEGLLGYFLEGYGRRPDGVLLAFFRALHVVRYLVARGAGEPKDQVDACLQSAGKDMELVHAAYQARVWKEAAAAGVPRSETLALLPRGRADQRGGDLWQAPDLGPSDPAATGASPAAARRGARAGRPAR